MMSTAKLLCLERIETVAIPIRDLSVIVFEYVRHTSPEYLFYDSDWQFCPIFISPRGCGKTMSYLSILRFAQSRTIFFYGRHQSVQIPFTYFPLFRSISMAAFK